MISGFVLPFILWNIVSGATLEDTLPGREVDEGRGTTTEEPESFETRFG
jgi:hypothetical protein